MVNGLEMGVGVWQAVQEKQNRAVKAIQNEEIFGISFCFKIKKGASKQLTQNQLFTAAKIIKLFERFCFGYPSVF